MSQQIAADSVVDLPASSTDNSRNRAAISWLVATAAGIVLLVALPLAFQQPGNQVADSSTADSAAENQNLPEAGGEAYFASEGVSGEVMGGMGALALDDEAAESMEEMLDPNLPLVYINVDADDIPHVPAVLASNGVAVDRQYSAPAEELAAGFSGDGVVEPGDDPNADNRPEGKPVVASPSLPADKEQLSVLIVEGSPEQLARAWQQLGKTKTTVVAQQAGTRLPGISYAPEEAKLANARRAMYENRQRFVNENADRDAASAAGSENLLRASPSAGKPGESPMRTQAKVARQAAVADAGPGSGAAGGGAGVSALQQRAIAQRKSAAVRVRLIIQVTPDP